MGGTSLRILGLLATLAQHGQEAIRPQTTAEKILRAVAMKPGITPGDLRQSADVSAGTIYYHLQHLEETGRIHTIVSGRRRLIFEGPAGADHGLRAAQLNLLRGKTANRVGALVLKEPGSSILHLVLRLGESPRMVYYHVRRLKHAGLVWSSSNTRYRDLRPTSDLAGCLAALGKAELNDD